MGVWGLQGLVWKKFGFRCKSLIHLALRHTISVDTQTEPAQVGFPLVMCLDEATRRRAAAAVSKSTDKKSAKGKTKSATRRKAA